jgi:uncharacterized membrane protein YraQ (UPF0718 family)
MSLFLNEVLRIIQFVWEAFVHIWPLLLVSIPLAVLIKELDISHTINTIFRKNIWVAILLATVLGAVAPFCSCGVIPVISALLIAGVPIAPVMAFWLASPSMDPEIFFLSVSSLGWSLAVARIIATFLMSITGGVVAHLLFGKKDVADYLLLNKVKEKAGNSCGCSTEQDTCSDNGASTKTCDDNASQIDTCDVTNKNTRLNHLGRSIISSTWFVVKFLLVAYILEAIIILYVPTEVVTGIFGDNPFTSVLIASLVGIPLYTTNLSALGLVGGLLAKGLSGGAGLAFLVGGATTTIPAMAAVYKLVDRKIFGVYLGVTILSSVLSGWIFNLIEVLM